MIALSACLGSLGRIILKRLYFSGSLNFKRHQKQKDENAKFILLRGHQGSGKSTFASEKIAEFQNAYPQAKIYHIENDKELTDANGM